MSCSELRSLKEEKMGRKLEEPLDIDSPDTASEGDLLSYKELPNKVFLKAEKGVFLSEKNGAEEIQKTSDGFKFGTRVGEERVKKEDIGKIYLPTSIENDEGERKLKFKVVFVPKRKKRTEYGDLKDGVVKLQKR